jgi:hypothetical protein
LAVILIVQQYNESASVRGFTHISLGVTAVIAVAGSFIGAIPGFIWLGSKNPPEPVRAALYTGLLAWVGLFIACLGFYLWSVALNAFGFTAEGRRVLAEVYVRLDQYLLRVPFALLGAGILGTMFGLARHRKAAERALSMK